jgi:hypothetical protein
MDDKKPIGENVSTFIMALLLGSVGCGFASLTSEDYFRITTNTKNEKVQKYGIFKGDHGGSECLGNCNDDCLVYKILPVIGASCGLIAVCLLTFTYPSNILKLNKEIAAWVIIVIGFCTGLCAVLFQLYNSHPNGSDKSLIQLVTADSCDSTDVLDCQDFQLSEGFVLTCTMVGLLGIAAIIQGVNHIELIKCVLIDTKSKVVSG